MVIMILEVLCLAILTVFVSAVEFIAGFGISTIMIPVLMLFISPVHAIFFTSVIDLVHNFFKMWIVRKKPISWYLVFRFGTSAVIATSIGALLIFLIPEILFQQLIGLLLLVYVWFLNFNPEFHVPSNTLSVVAAGGIYGFISGMFGIGGVLRTAILIAFNLSKETYLATHSITSLLVSITRFGTYISQGAQLSTTLLFALIACIPLTFIGVFVGRILFSRISPKQLRLIISFLLSLMGLKFLLIH